MNTLTIMGLGPGDADYLTLAASELFNGQGALVLRTEKHPVADYLRRRNIQYSSFDEVYETAESFDEVYQTITTRLIAQLADGPVVYAVPGNPFLAEKTVTMLLAQLPADQVAICHGSSFLDVLMTRLQHDPVAGLSVVDALNLSPYAQYDGDTLICLQCHSSLVAGELKLWLNRRFDDLHAVIIAQSIGIAEQEAIIELPLYQLDSYQKFDHHTSVVVIADDKLSRHHLPALSAIVARLRAPDGCPWDREQDHSSIKNSVIEEAYEVAEAIEQGDLFALEDELGDLLLQVVFHAQLASENGDFDIYDVTEGICQKLIRRHPHVFADSDVRSTDEVLENWEAIKQRESNHQTTSDVMQKYSRALPAVFRSQKVSKKAIKSGFTWQCDDQALAKVREELDELAEAMTRDDRPQIIEELGDCYYALGVVANRLDVAAEQALHRSTDKFIGRFKIMEEKLAESSLKIADLSLSELIEAWQVSKRTLSGK